MKKTMKKRTCTTSFLLVVAILSLLLTTSCYRQINICEWNPSPEVNVLEDRYIIKEAEYTIATYGGDLIKKPMVSQFNNISRQKTLNARLNVFNEMVERNPIKDRNEQLYQSYKIQQMNYYLFSCEYFTAFETTVSNKGVNMIIGSEIDGTLLMNFPVLLGRNLDSETWTEFLVFFEEARIAAGAKEITKEYMTTDNVSFVFEGDDLTDLTLRVLYKVADDTEQQEVPMKLNDIKGCLSERMQVYFSFTDNKDITYGEYALNIEEHKGYYE